MLLSSIFVIYKYLIFSFWSFGFFLYSAFSILCRILASVFKIVFFCLYYIIFFLLDLVNIVLYIVLHIVYLELSFVIYLVLHLMRKKNLSECTRQTFQKKEVVNLFLSHWMKLNALFSMIRCVLGSNSLVLGLFHEQKKKTCCQSQVPGKLFLIWKIN